MKEIQGQYNTVYLIAEKSDLEKLHTKVLIDMIHLSKRTNNTGLVNFHPWRWGEHNEYVIYDMDSNWVKVYKESELREILKTRPHIPNKKEAKAIRQQKSKQHKK